MWFLFRKGLALLAWLEAMLAIHFILFFALISVRQGSCWVCISVLLILCWIRFTKLREVAQDPYLHIWQCAGATKRKNCAGVERSLRTKAEFMKLLQNLLQVCDTVSFPLTHLCNRFSNFYHSGITTRVLRDWNINETSRSWCISETFVKVKYWPLLLNPQIIIQLILKSEPDKIVSCAPFR